MPSRWDVEKAILRSNVDSRGRLIVLALLAKADNDTAVTKPEHTPAFDTLAAMTGLSKAVLSEWLQALEDGRWVTRSKPEKGGKGNRTIYTLTEGEAEIVRRSRDLRKPRPKAKGSPSEPFEDAQTVRPANPLTANSSPSEPFSEPKGFAGRTPKGSPSEPFQPSKGSLGEPATTLRTTKNHQPVRETNSDPAEPSAPPADENPIPGAPVNAPSTPDGRWAEGGRKPSTPTAVHGRAAALFPAPRMPAVETWMDIYQVIYRWLQANNYQAFGLDEVRQIHKQLAAAHPGKNLRYVTTVVSNGGCAAYAEKIRKDRHKRVEDLVKSMQATLPQCDHGIPAGSHPHPTTGALLCAQCRRGIPAQPAEDATNPDVQAAIDAYRRRRGNDIYFPELLNITQQIEAFFAEGASPTQVTALAEVAGEQRISLVQAAGVAA